MLFTEPKHLASQLPHYLFDFAAVFSHSHFQTMLVGGAVRDLVLGKSPGDFDFCTDAQPADVMKLFRTVIPTGIEHGTVTVRFRGYSIEVTTFRIDGDYRDNRRPENVAFTDDLRTDVSRRDFTINALALALPDCRIIDYTQGLGDLSAGIIRAIGVPEQRFSEDALRVLRGLRFAAVLGFAIDVATMEAMQRTASGINNVACERIRTEWIKLLSGAYLERALPLLADIDILRFFTPISDQKIESFNKIAQTLHTVSKNAQRLLPPQEWEWRYAAFLFFSRALNCSPLSPGKDSVVLKTFLHDRRYTKKEINAILDRVAAISCPLPQATTIEIRRYLFAIQPCDWDMTARARETVGCSTPDNIHITLLLAEQQRRGVITGAQDLDIGGRDLQQELGHQPGPWIGETIRYLIDQVVIDPELNTREQLLRLAASHNSHPVS